jgi:NADPH:quinone reductase-like Zn-dependent oxidoreductase
VVGRELANSMKAIVFQRYGGPDVLEVADVDIPAPNDHQVLIKVHCGAVNPADHAAMHGNTRVMTGVFKPRINRLGIDVAGEVAEVGRKVTRFKPGDEVYGGCIRNPWAFSQTSWFSDYGSFAEYAVSHEDSLDFKPDNLTFAEAASVPSVAWTALQGLRKYGRIQAGHRVLINSATGGVGTLAVQIAKALGGEVTGVCSTKNIELVKSLGADHVIDYVHENYVEPGVRYDLVFDSVGTEPLRSLRNMLNPGGKVVMVGVRNHSLIRGMFARALSATVMSWITGGDVVVDYSRPTPDDLRFISELLSSERIRPVVAKQFDGLAKVADAQRFVIDGHAWGKAVVSI